VAVYTETLSKSRQGGRVHRMVTQWLFLVVALVMVLVVFGGYVRLTRSGLSIVEWKVVTGTLPPLSQEAWEAEFAKYQATPEYQKVNRGMTLDEYRRIYYIEYFHRLIARIAGLLVVIPLAIFLVRGAIPWRRAGPYLAIPVLFGVQGFLGWYMVSSGLEDNPAVSHFRLTIHLLTALAILGWTLWLALSQVYGGPGTTPQRNLVWGTRAVLAVLVLQIAYGGLVAGLKAGWISNTWPRMFGAWIPQGLLSTLEPWWWNLLENAATVHFVHRWFAFVVALAVVALAVAVYRSRTPLEPSVRRAALALVLLVGIQIGLGIGVVWFSVPLWLALVHQATALLLFMDTLFLTHRLYALSG